jgi:hypothetical protein
MVRILLDVSCPANAADSDLEKLADAHAAERWGDVFDRTRERWCLPYKVTLRGSSQGRHDKLTDQDGRASPPPGARVARRGALAGGRRRLPLPARPAAAAATVFTPSAAGRRPSR